MNRVSIDVAKRLGAPCFEGMPIEALAQPIPAQVITAIKNAPNQGVFNVTGSVAFAGNILKCDDIVFSPQSTLELSALGTAVDFVAVVARRFRFAAPDLTTVIQRPPSLNAAAGSKGAGGPRGGNGPHDDAHGYPGGTGGPGGPGSTIQFPKLYVLGEEVLKQPSTPIEWLNLYFMITGVDGGDGGTGGTGGAGGDGASGHSGSDSCCDCRRGPGDGGNGGEGGPGGIGGPGAPGGNGVELIYGGPSAFLDLILYSKVFNQGGAGGRGGRGGSGGTGGGGGPRGSNTFYCKGGSPGRSGRDGGTGPRGQDGADGAKGRTDISPLASLNAFY